ncbi:apolipoprotein N-acyltransferase [Pseudomethylobacillus aquaticus]|uniref:Apolipoprotein N-acyltransferase n=1 Tax=Pseudomethylobacillus aquaticus TaxID=2676064 RepID=A0A3N0V743_9PROT|nr:apolipoprotein N-acyltransferase [Pseudomethylobacillus aquaticus]ROH88626.1 apolipoprotein N-acyltransferase [Pseudomethylobacillus aquaticus]
MNPSSPRLLFPYLLALLLGAGAMFGYAPFYLFPLPVLALAGLFWLWQRAGTAGQAARLGFSFGLGLFGAGIYWIYISLHTYGGMPPAGAAFATFCLAAFLALFPALAGWLSKHGPALLITAPVWWALADWTRGWIFTGFPWMTVGYSQVPGSPLAGYTPLLGIYGISLLTAASAALLVLLLQPAKRKPALLALVGLWLAGSLLKLVPWTTPDGEPVSVALLQGNISQDLKWQPEEAQRTLDGYLQLVQNAQAKLIVLPETALPMLLQQAPEDYLQALAEHGKQQQGDVLVGIVEYENAHYYNTMLSLGSAESQRYRKSHLVPFGEFIPLKAIFGWVYQDWLNIPLTDFARGGFAQRPLQIAGQRVAVNICYEDVFGEEIIHQLPEATLLVNTSNDAWYGRSTAAYQHLQISQARALETGRVMLRATNTGATAVIDRDGRVLSQLPHFETATLSAEVQGYRGSTPFIVYGNYGFLLLALLILLLTRWRARAWWSISRS